MLNSDQQKAADGFFQFLMGPETELIISGPAGTGKTFLMGYLIDKVIPRYQDTCKLLGIPPVYSDVIMTATTNKAAEVLSHATQIPCITIHSLLGLMVTDDMDTGRTNLKRSRNWNVVNDSIIFIDECSMIDSELYKYIQQGTKNCKLVYVGDHCQLAPVFESLSPIYKKNTPFFELTIPMRNQKQPKLMEVCEQLRDTVKTGVFQPIPVIPGIIDLVDDKDMQNRINIDFKNTGNTNKVLAYTNNRVIEYNNYIQDLRQHHQYEEGEYYVNNMAVKLKDLNGKTQLLNTEEIVQITYLNKNPIKFDLTDQIQIDVYVASIMDQYKRTFPEVLLPKDIPYIKRILKYLAKNKDWFNYFKVKEYFPDLRPKDASTVHKAQGSTFDTVYIDLGDISTCRIPQMAARLLYVAFTRARNNVVMYGNLAERFGGIKT